MGTRDTMKRYVAPKQRSVLPRTRLSRRKPRAYEEWKAFVREAEVLRFLRTHLYGVSCVRAVSPGRSRRR